MQLDEETGEFSVKGQFDHPYPTTRILWIPDSVCVLLVILSYHTSSLSLSQGVSGKTKVKSIFGKLEKCCSYLQYFLYNIDNDKSITKIYIVTSIL